MINERRQQRNNKEIVNNLMGNNSKILNKLIIKVNKVILIKISNNIRNNNLNNKPKP